MTIHRKTWEQIESLLDPAVPVVVDLDGTLIRTDLLYEGICRLATRMPVQLFALPFWLLKGKAFLKNQVANRIAFRADELPYNSDLVAFLQLLNERGFKLVLASASSERYVRDIAAHLNVFAMSVGSTDTRNLRGTEKLAKIYEFCDSGKFVYIGDSAADIPIWRKAVLPILFNSSRFVQSRVDDLGAVAVVSKERHALKIWAKQLRVHQWAKNSLIFLPLLASHSYSSPSIWAVSFIAFFAFSFMASSIYILNDLCDLEADRRHERKRTRPLASGRISIISGFFVGTMLALLAFAVGALLNGNFLSVLAVYAFVNIFYSFKGKSLLVLDVVLLASMYTLRIIAGGAATGIPGSTWLMGFSIFFFLGLALMKRASEIAHLQEVDGRVKGRAYEGTDKTVVVAIGCASSLLSLLVLVLYFESANVQKLYSRHEYLWFTIPLLAYWISRTWILANRSRMGEDPVLFALKDAPSWIVLSVVGITFWVAAR